MDSSTKLECSKTELPMIIGDQSVVLRAHAYRGSRPDEQVLVLIHEVPEAGDAVPKVRLHSGCVTGDVFRSQRCDCHEQLQEALRRVVAAPRGAVVYLPHHEGRGIGLFNKIRAYALQDQGYDTVDANIHSGYPVDAREYDLAVAILRDLGWMSVVLMTNNPHKIDVLQKSGIHVEVEPIVVPESPWSKKYIDTKRTRMGHRF